MATKPKWCSLGNNEKHSIRESYIIGGIIGTHTYSIRERDLWEGYPSKFLFHIHENLYNRDMVGAVVPAPTNPSLHCIYPLRAFTYFITCIHTFL